MSGKYASLTSSGNVLGFDLVALKSADWTQPINKRELLEFLDFKPTVGMTGWGRFSDEEVSAVMQLVGRWLTARWEHNWEKADRIKGASAQLGLRLQVDKRDDDRVSGTAVVERSFDPAKLEALQ